MNKAGIGHWRSYLIAVLLIGFSIPVLGQEMGAVSSWHQESESFRVYLGVVPVNLIQRKPVLIDDDKTLHGGAAQQSPAAHHIMVAIFDKESNRRVKDATVIAEVGPQKLFGSKDVERPLERMKTSGTISYGNFFDLHKSGAYDIEVWVYRPTQDNGERVRFVFQKP